MANKLIESVTIDKKLLEKNIEKLIIDEYPLVLIAESKNSIVGYLSGYFHNTIYAYGKTAYIDKIIVSHKKGIMVLEKSQCRSLKDFRRQMTVFWLLWQPQEPKNFTKGCSTFQKHFITGNIYA